MATLEATLPLLGRIRAGDKVLTADGKSTRPNRLENFRLTSDNKPRLDFAQSLGWGDEVTEWTDAPGGRQWQLYLTLDALPVWVPPEAAFSQYDELWAGDECIYRCDGDTVIKGLDGTIKKTGEAYQLTAFEGGPCSCDQFDPPVPTVTRVSLLLPDIPGLGVWRLDTKGYYAGKELQGVVQFLESAARKHGAPVDAIFTLQTRAVVRRTLYGKREKRVFLVPSIQPTALTPRQIMQLQAAPVVPQLPPPVPTIDEAFGDRGAIDTKAQSEAVDAASAEASAKEERARMLQSIKQAREDHGIALPPFIEWIDSTPGLEKYGLQNGLAKAPMETLRLVLDHIDVADTNTCNLPLGTVARPEGDDAEDIYGDDEELALLNTESDAATKRTEDKA